MKRRPPLSTRTDTHFPYTSLFRSPASESFAPLGPWARMRRRALRHGGVLFGGGLLLTCILVALAAPWLAPHDPYAQDLTRRLIDPVWAAKGSWVHPLGTDQLGRDYLSRLIYGSRVRSEEHPS